MAVASPAKESSPVAFDLRSAALTLVAVALKTADLATLARALDERFADAPGLFDRDPVAIDLAALAADDAVIDFPALVELLTRHRMIPVAVRGGSPAQREAALAAGLSEASEPAAPREAAAAPAPAPEPVLTEVVREIAAAAPALVIDKPLRSGQQVYARGGDVVVLAAVNFGAEVIADGSVHVYGPLRGRAIAGARGDASARIYTACLEAQLVAVAGTYRTIDAPLAGDVWGKPAQVRLAGERLLVEPLNFE